MARKLIILISLLATTLMANASLKDISLTRLEQRVAAIDEEIEHLASLNLRSGSGAIGYRSAPHTTQTNTEWVQIEFGAEFPIDEIVLVPCIWRSTETGFQADGFPLEFQLIAGKENESEGSVLSSYTEQDELLPRIAPLKIPCPGTKASWVRLEVTRLSPRGWDGMFILNLAELLIFSGTKNIALRQPVSCSTQSPLKKFSAWGAHHLTDGFVPYLMDAAKSDKSNAYVSEIGVADTLTLTIDLQEALPISQINLHAVEQSDTVPQSNIGDFGIPEHLRIEGALKPDFSDAIQLVDYQPSSIYEIGPIIMWNLPETQCRFIRLNIIDPYHFDDGTKSGMRTGFAEIEVFSGGINVACNKPVQANYEEVDLARKLTPLTDGHNFYGKILPIRGWMDELARRHDLEKERPVIVAELNKRYARQKTNLNRMIWLAALLGAGIAFTILIERLIRFRQIARIKERFAANLHDELGANVHSIAMLSDLAQDADSPEEWKTLHQRIWNLTQRTSKAIRYCTNMLESEGLYIGLIKDMQRAAERISTNFKHEFSVEGEQWTNRIKPRIRIDFFLFYKECLVNICRHSGATRIRTHLKVTPKDIHLSISDNGKGLPGATGNTIPKSLKRRAHLMGATVSTENPDDGGTRITLRLRRRIFGILNR